MNDHNMHVRFVIKSLEVEGGGAERVLVNVANGLAARGYKVSVVTFDRPGAPSFYALSSGIKRAGIGIGKPGAPTPRLKLVAGMARFRGAVSAESPDVVVGFMHSTYVPLAIATLGTGLRLVASEHIGRSHFATRPIQRMLVAALERRFCAITVPSSMVFREQRERQRAKTVVLPNPVSLVNEDHAWANVDTGRVLLCVGRFMKQKDHASLIEAFARTRDEFPGWTLRLVGDGELRPEIEKQIQSLGLSGSVELPGVVHNMTAEYARAAIVVMPSYYESFGLAVVEALACGRPVVGFRECLEPLGIAINGQNALLVDGTGDRVASLAGGLRALMLDDDLRRRLGQAGPASVERFGSEQVVDQWDEFLRRCVGRG